MTLSSDEGLSARRGQFGFVWEEGSVISHSFSLRNTVDWIEGLDSKLRRIFIIYTLLVFAQNFLRLVQKINICEIKKEMRRGVREGRKMGRKVERALSPPRK